MEWRERGGERRERGGEGKGERGEETQGPGAIIVIKLLYSSLLNMGL